MQYSDNPYSERERRYVLPTDVSMYNMRGAFYPAAIQRMAVGMIENHLEKLGMDAPRLVREYGVSWVLLSFSAELRRPLRPAEAYTARTWHTRAKPPIFRRDFVICDAAEQVTAVGATFSTLLDVKKRRICTDRALLGRFCLPDGEELLDADHRFSADAAFREVERRHVRPSWLDGVGHVNNLRYAELAYDALDEGERLRVDALRRMDVWFRTELTEGTEFSMEKAAEGEALLLRGVIQPSGQPAFVVRLA